MRVIIMLVAIMSAFLSNLYEQTIGRLHPIDPAQFATFRQRRVIPDDRLGVSCPTNDVLPTTERTIFSRGGCVVYGYPSTGGVLIKDADFVDMLFLSLNRSHPSQRSPSAEEEDRFCNLLRKAGAKWWSSREDQLEALFELREMTEEEEKVVVFGWPTDGVGVWVLRFMTVDQLPRDYGRMHLAMNMEERIQIMKDYGATFVEDVTQVGELRDTF